MSAAEPIPAEGRGRLPDFSTWNGNFAGEGYNVVTNGVKSGFPGVVEPADQPIIVSVVVGREPISRLDRGWTTGPNQLAHVSKGRPSS